jgi:hypothetical protein
MDEQPSDPVWPLSLAHVVEPRTDWSVSAGAGHLGSPHGRSLRSITSYVRGEMVSNGNYGRPRPAVRTLSARRITVHGAHAFVLESQFRLNASYRRASHERVHVEKSWTLAIRVGRNDYSLWFVSIPDLAKRLWRTVPADIASIRVI